jgi:hypothetical protein
MRRRKFITMLGGAAIAWPLAARAQQASSIPKVGFLYPGPEANAKMRSALMLEGLRTQGFREPEQVVVLVRATGGDPARSAPLFAELVANKIDILLPMGGLTLTIAGDAAAANIPIVTFDFELDPVESGLLKSLAHPGGNVTGVFLDLPDLSTAWLELADTSSVCQSGRAANFRHESPVEPFLPKDRAIQFFGLCRLGRKQGDCGRIVRASNSEGLVVRIVELPTVQVMLWGAGMVPWLDWIVRGGDLATVKPIFRNESHLRATFASPLNSYQAGSFEWAQCPTLCVGLDAPVLQHDVGNNKGVGLS